MKLTKRFLKKSSDLALFYSGCTQLGLDVNAPIPELMRTNVFVTAINKLWFPKGLKAFHFVTKDKFITEGNAGRAMPGLMGPLGMNAILTGKSSVYYDYYNAFTSPLQLFVTMAHEMVHVSQIGALAGINLGLWKNEQFRYMLESQAHSFSNLLGGNYWNPAYNKDWAAEFPDYYNKVNYINYNWIYTCALKPYWP
jgi:hypothetical protein